MRYENGWSLSELLIVIVITALLLSSGIHFGREYLYRYRQDQAIHQLQQTLQFAKQAAMYNRQPVKVCAAGNEGQCGDNWNNGLIVMLNNGSNTSLMQTSAIKLSGRVFWRGWLHHPYPQFDSDGMPHGYHGSFLWCNNHYAAPLVVMNHLGRIRIVTDVSHDQTQDSSC